MQTPNSSSLACEINGQRIRSVKNQERFSSRNFKIYETNFSQFFFKVYTHKNPAVNRLLKQSNVSSTAEVNKDRKYAAIKILKVADGLGWRVWDGYRGSLWVLACKRYRVDGWAYSVRLVMLVRRALAYSILYAREGSV